MISILVTKKDRTIKAIQNKYQIIAIIKDIIFEVVLAFHSFISNDDVNTMNVFTSIRILT